MHPPPLGLYVCANIFLENTPEQWYTKKIKLGRTTQLG